MRPSSTEPVSWDPFGVDKFGTLPSEDSMFGREFDQLQRGAGSGERELVACNLGASARYLTL